MSKMSNSKRINVSNFVGVKKHKWADVPSSQGKSTDHHKHVYFPHLQGGILQDGMKLTTTVTLDDFVK